ncbi:hypothetical protein M3M33_16190, partial [Loigolactobacillus coryniformis]|uniref:hypothetical protein n=1 Tax=Loigolactobacillus coryniformis TaxID=1610 RepID=UPI00201B2E6B
YSVTTKVAQYNDGKGTFDISGDTKQQLDKAFEYYFKMDGMADNGLSTLDQALQNSTTRQLVQDSFKSGKVQIAVSTLYDSL